MVISTVVAVPLPMMPMVPTVIPVVLRMRAVPVRASLATTAAATTVPGTATATRLAALRTHSSSRDRGNCHQSAGVRARIDGRHRRPVNSGGYGGPSAGEKRRCGYRHCEFCHDCLKFGFNGRPPGERPADHPTRISSRAPS